MIGTIILYVYIRIYRAHNQPSSVGPEREGDHAAGAGGGMETGGGSPRSAPYKPIYTPVSPGTLSPFPPEPFVSTYAR